jgi:hypothetical protein
MSKDIGGRNHSGRGQHNPDDRNDGLVHRFFLALQFKDDGYTNTDIGAM